MLYWLTEGTLQIGFRVLGAALTAFLIAFVGGRWITDRLARNGIIERTDRTPIEDEKLRAQIDAKAGTPTMGGLILLAALLPACLLWGHLRDIYLWLAVACFITLSALGMLDDWMKLAGKGHRSRGLKLRYKLLIQGLIGCALGAVYWRELSAGHGLPGGDWAVWLGPLAVLWVALVVATMSNAVNVTDGLDGLAGALSVIVLVPLGIVAYRYSRVVAGGTELVLYCGALGGAMLGFLRHNWHPARVFMGDTGALAVGGSIGLVAVLVHGELLLPLIAFVFLAEFGSSVLQVLYFKATGRRILPIAPLHHIWQQKGVPETRIVARLLIVALVAGVCALAFV